MQKPTQKKKKRKVKKILQPLEMPLFTPPIYKTKTKQKLFDAN